ncbi:hypothetical protein E2K80_16270 [Rhodophyticola sp. CCM32]|uniref:hypothetical protein n=1 Tax=Rhodophyticola sp. CCM32 TaxID=2916397 RepID=UPI00107EFB3F|nr:hypothetical protein [Rhodophyticola sp. CCM32]QBY02098.1 hypothetical protein E2K80_16270 [Rhodophyticola sp. CCM32]
MTLTRTRLHGGRYEGILTATDMPPVIEVVHLDHVIGTVELGAGDGKNRFQVGFDLPGWVLSDGVQVISLRSAADGEVLDRITVLAGSVLDEDIRAEIALLRDELDLLKRAFRRHCTETGED